MNFKFSKQLKEFSHVFRSDRKFYRYTEELNRNEFFQEKVGLISCREEKSKKSLSNHHFIIKIQN